MLPSMTAMITRLTDDMMILAQTGCTAFGVAAVHCLEALSNMMVQVYMDTAEGSVQMLIGNAVACNNSRN